METHTFTPPLDPARLRRLVAAQEARLGASMDPLRKLIRRRSEGINVTLRRMQQFEALRKGRDCGPFSDYGV